MKFGAPWGREVMIVTALGLVALGAPLVVLIVRSNAVFPLLITGSVLLVTALLCVRGYVLRPHQLVIRRLLWSTRWPIDPGTRVTIRPNAMEGSWRTWGNAGLFAISGHFAGSGLGRYRAFVTDPRRTVVLETAAGVVVVSPDRPEDFARAVDESRSAA